MDEAIRALYLDMNMTSNSCIKCGNPVLDEVARSVSYCDSCGHVWLDNEVRNPITDLI